MTTIQSDGARPPLRPLPFSDIVTVRLGEAPITPLEVEAVSRGNASIALDDIVYERLDRARAVVEIALKENRPVYGLNRGLGSARDESLPNETMEEFQEFIIAAHSSAVGRALPPDDVRAVIFARLAVMAQGGSGGSRELFNGLLQLLEKNVTPVIPSLGSVGSADLSQMAAIGAVLIGRGRAFDPDSQKIISGKAALDTAGLSPITLRAKDGISLIGTNSASIGLASLLVRRLEASAYAADVIAAFTLEAFFCNLSPFSEFVVRARPLAGQMCSAERIREALAGGDLEDGSVLPRSLQDPLSIRTIPQVHGAFIEQIHRLEEILTTELNSRSENPLVDAESGQIYSNGNFSAVTLAITLESIRLAIAHVGSMTERRIANLVEQARTQVSVVDQMAYANTHGGYLLPVIITNTASSIVTRLQHLANPVSTMSTIVSDGVEDHNSQAYVATQYASKSLYLLEELQAIEALLAADTLRRAENATAPETRHSRRLGPRLTALRDAVQDATRTLGPDVTTDVVIAQLRETIARTLESDHDASPAAQTAPRIIEIDRDGEVHR